MTVKLESQFPVFRAKQLAKLKQKTKNGPTCVMFIRVESYLS